MLSCIDVLAPIFRILPQKKDKKISLNEKMKMCYILALNTKTIILHNFFVIFSAQKVTKKIVKSVAIYHLYDKLSLLYKILCRKEKGIYHMAKETKNDYDRTPYPRKRDH